MNICHSLVCFEQMASKLISRKTFLSAGMAMELMRSEHEFNVDEALRYGIIHDVVDNQQVHILSQFGAYEPW